MTNDTSVPPFPVTRDLEKLVEAFRIVEAELGFQVHRLNEHVRPKTESELEYHENLKAGYTSSRQWVGILKRYHEGRLERERGQHQMFENTPIGGAHFDEEEGR